MSDPLKNQMIQIHVIVPLSDEDRDNRPVMLTLANAGGKPLKIERAKFGEVFNVSPESVISIAWANCSTDVLTGDVGEVLISVSDDSSASEDDGWF